LFASGGYQPAAISVRSVHDAVPTRTSPMPTDLPRSAALNPGPGAE